MEEAITELTTTVQNEETNVMINAGTQESSKALVPLKKTLTKGEALDHLHD